MRKQQVAMSAAEEARIWALLRSSLEMSKQLEEEMAQCKAELRGTSSLAPYTPSPLPRSDALQHSQQSNLSIWGFPLQGRYTLLCSPEVKAGPEIFFGGAMRTAELQPEAYGEVSAVELSPEVNMATSEGPAQRRRLPRCPAWPRRPSCCPVQLRRPSRCPAWPRKPSRCPARPRRPSRCPARPRRPPSPPVPPRVAPRVPELPGVVPSILGVVSCVPVPPGAVL
ncbi:protein stum homolog isoform X1 [Ictalurus punctatus]|uniref:Protein stum homolog isoform X1 n=1 Tax=Ictalurus punctatus TaxID=7998 RepID=A0A9F7TSE9_ICTPU|nr:protein stum homolog isoform X1 [Ictalurus punctatus]